MTEHHEVRRRVSRTYGSAVSSWPVDGGGDREQKGVLVKLAGYKPDELADLPTEAVVNAFGCGNPLAFSGVQPGEVVLDLGSGAGIDLLLAARIVGPSGRVIGVDMTDEMIAAARRAIAASDWDNVELRRGLIEALPVDSTSVDWVISNCVINMSPQKGRVFKEIARVLKPGGRMLVSDVVIGDLPSWVRESPRLCNCCVATAISERDYCAGLREAGLVEVEVRERLEYDASQLEALFDSKLADPEDAPSRDAGQADQASWSRKLAAQCAGRVWSAKIFARKPA
ncbi:MAG: methyltransferase domain-containing protein [bacterium]|nr:methyltransferase domain-containing protein [bacterium]